MYEDKSSILLQRKNMAEQECVAELMKMYQKLTEQYH